MDLSFVDRCDIGGRYRWHLVWGVGLLLEFTVVPLLVPPNTPSLSYGQEFAFIMLPLAVLFGAAIGSSLALGRIGRKLWCAGGLFISTLVVWGTVSSLWVSQVKQYGRDASEVVLYAPFLAVSVVALIVALVCVVKARSR